MVQSTNPPWVPHFLSYLEMFALDYSCQLIPPLCREVHQSAHSHEACSQSSKFKLRSQLKELVQNIFVCKWLTVELGHENEKWNLITCYLCSFKRPKMLLVRMRLPDPQLVEQLSQSLHSPSLQSTGQGS